jgi:hypothetical protein
MGQTRMLNVGCVTKAEIFILDCYTHLLSSLRELDNPKFSFLNAGILDVFRHLLVLRNYV